MTDDTVPTGLTMTELAHFLGVSGGTVTYAKNTGRISAACFHGNRCIDPQRAAEEYAVHRRHPRNTQAGGNRRPVGDGPAPGETLLELQTKHEKVKLRERQLKLDRAQAQVIEKRLAEKRLFELIRAERERIQNWPADIAGRLAAQFKLDPVACEVALEAAVRDLLAGMTAEALLEGAAVKDRAA